MINKWFKNFLNGNYERLEHKLVPAERIYDYAKIVIVGLDSASNRIFVACLEHDIYPYGYCNALDGSFAFWAEDFDFLKPVKIEACCNHSDCALVMSEFTYRAVGHLFQSDIYIVTTELDSPIFNGRVRCFYRLNDSAGFDSAKENDLGNFVSKTSTGALKTLSLEAIAYRYSYGKRMIDLLSKRSETQFIFLVTGAVGDNTAICCMVEEYKKRFGFEKVAVLIQDNKAEIAEMFPAIDEVICCQRIDLICLANYFILNYTYGRRDFGNVVFAYYMPTSLRWTEFVHSQRDYELTLFIKYREMLGLPLDAKPSEAVVMAGKKVVYPQYENSILLIPDGNAIYRDIDFHKEKAFSFFANLTRELEASGLKVYLNKVDSNSEAILGAEPIYLTLTELVASASSFKCIIAFPSGVGELLNLTHCRLIHVWPSELEYNMRHFESYGGCAEASHYLYSEDNAERLIKDIVLEMAGE